MSDDSAAAATTAVAPLSGNYLRQFLNWRKSMGLPNPGSFEQLHREVRGVFVTNFLFDGAKFDFGKGLSDKFHVQHSFSMGSQVQPATYNFGSIYVDGGLFLNGSIDHEGSLNARANYSITRKLTAKTQMQLGTQAGASMAQLEVDYAGMDYSANIKAVNPSPVDGTGIFVGSFLQSVSKRLALGVEVGVQRPRPDINETQTSLVAKYSGSNYVLTSNLSQIGILQCSYYHRVSPKVELGTELQLMTAEGRRDGLCTVGGKWDFQAATFRGQIDTTGRVSAVLEEKMAPGFSILITGDIDHMKGQSRFGIGMQLES